MQDTNHYTVVGLDSETELLKLHPGISMVLDEYFELDFSGTIVKTPYYINTKRRKDLRALVGKGTAAEIILETKVWAQVHKLDLNTASATEIRDLMLRVGIGIDCSGLVVHALAEYFRRTLKVNLYSHIKYQSNSLRARLARAFRPVENLGANELTSSLNTHPIDMHSVLPGDLIRGMGKQRNAYHVAIVSEVSRTLTKTQPVVTKIKYVHSHRGYGAENGVRRGEIIVNQPHKDLLDQNWTEVHTDGRNYIYEEVSFDIVDSGLRRLRILG